MTALPQARKGFPLSMSRDVRRTDRSGLTETVGYQYQFAPFIPVATLDSGPTKTSSPSENHKLLATCKESRSHAPVRPVFLRESSRLRSPR